MFHKLDPSVLLLGRKWATPVLLELIGGKRSFNVLLDSVPGINAKSLAARLEDFQNAGLIVKREGLTKPRQTRYELTAKGEEFRTVTKELVGFSVKWHNA